MADEQRKPFWTPEAFELAQRCDRESDLVVADWLEERECLVAAEVFRREGYHFWRKMVLMLAETAPEMRPSGPALTMLDLAVQQSAAQQKAIADAMPYGVDLEALGLKAPPPLPILG